MGLIFGMAEFDYIVVGAGFFGSTVAQKLADKKKRVLIIDKRNHIAGNAYSYINSSSKIEIHKYGTHIFHTNVTPIWEYVNQFGQFNNYVHRVTTMSQGQRLPIPINFETLVAVLGKERASDFAQKVETSVATVKRSDSDNLKDWAISSVGPELYDRVIAGYTEKQWGLPPDLLPSSIISRLPIRTDLEDRYFTDRYQGVPLDGYEALVQNQLDSNYITLELECDFLDIRQQLNTNQYVIYTGPIDKFFSYQEGELGWRTLDFQVETLQCADFQGCAVQNYADLDVPYTRIHEFKYLNPERKIEGNETVISREFSRFADKNDEPYYPINTVSDREKLLSYRELARKERNYFFGGRLGSYKYLDMHMAIGQALELISTFELDGHFE